ncbi:hypothetical protein ADUPG1_004921, partial [Aduncisulcus paluster]
MIVYFTRIDKKIYPPISRNILTPKGIKKSLISYENSDIIHPSGAKVKIDQTSGDILHILQIPYHQRAESKLAESISFEVLYLPLPCSSTNPSSDLIAFPDHPSTALVISIPEHPQDERILSRSHSRSELQKTKGCCISHLDLLIIGGPLQPRVLELVINLIDSPSVPTESSHNEDKVTFTLLIPKLKETVHKWMRINTNYSNVFSIGLSCMDKWEKNQDPCSFCSIGDILIHGTMPSGTKCEDIRRPPQKLSSFSESHLMKTTVSVEQQKAIGRKRKAKRLKITPVHPLPQPIPPVKPQPKVDVVVPPVKPQLKVDVGEPIDPST